MAVRDNSWTPYDDMVTNLVNDQVAEQVFPLVAVRLLAYLDENGDQRFVVNHIGDVPLSTTLGMLELAKLDLWQWHMKGVEDAS